jgi:uncharacterized protein
MDREFASRLECASQCEVLPETSMDGLAGASFKPEHYTEIIRDNFRCGFFEVHVDVNNVVVSATNIGFSCDAYLDEFPLYKVEEIHLAGYSEQSL